MKLLTATAKRMQAVEAWLKWLKVDSATKKPWKVTKYVGKTKDEE